jgi:hypothetical protein
MTQAFAGIVGIAISAILALVSGRAEANFIPGIVINSEPGCSPSTSLTAVLIGVDRRVSMGRNPDPLSGAIRRAKRRVLPLTTWLGGPGFALRLGVEVPLYLAHGLERPAGTKLLLGIFAVECCGHLVSSYVPSTEAPRPTSD